jgi:formylglycine-generating enzyme required for sulfatase activity/serine/threonine protein kinase
MSQAASDRNLLFGILAVQMDFVGRDALIAAMHAWVLERSKSLGRILLEHQALSPSRQSLLEQLVDEHLAAHGGDAEKSLAATDGLEAIRGELEQVADPEIRATLDRVPGAAAATGHDPEATLSYSEGSPTAGSRFAILRPHAQGGLGQISVALDAELKREVALKELRPERADDPGSRARFLLEAEITGRLEHPGVVPVYGLGCDVQGRPFYAMRLVRGQSLKDAITQFHRSSWRSDSDERAVTFHKLLREFIDVCYAIEYAHSRGVLHRDIKPGNVMLGQFGETLVVDWGLAKALGRPDSGKTAAPALISSAGETAPGSLIGTPQYMSPEQAAGRTDLLGPASDVYSLGATLFCLLTGQPPFPEGNVEDVLRRVQQGDFKAPRAVMPGVARALDAVCAKAMALRPTDRYAGPRALAEDVERWLVDGPVSAYREGLAARIARWTRRHRGSAVSAASALIVVAIALSYTFYESRVRALQVAQQRRVQADDLVDSLLAADVPEVPRIVARLRRDPSPVRDRLRTMVRTGGAEPAGLRAALALLPDDPGLADQLATQMLDARPGELLIASIALRDQGQGHVCAQFWPILGESAARLTQRQLRAAGALATLDPDDSRWRSLATPIAAGLVREDPRFLDAWREVFFPLADRLKGPLRQAYADRTRPEERASAFRLLLGFVTHRDNRRLVEDLADLVAEADPGQFHLILDCLTDRQRAIACLSAQLTDPPRFDGSTALREGRVAAALFVLGKAEMIWALFRKSDDPSLRTEVIHNLAPYGASSRVVIDRLKAEPDVSARRALILCLGEFDPDQVGEHESLVPTLLSWYRDDPDPGVHSAIDWLLRRRWKRHEGLVRIERELRGRTDAGRDWYIDKEGQTLAIIRGPIEFHMGSTPREAGREYDETYHDVRIERSFALATREVTVAQFRRSLSGDNVWRTERNEAIERYAPAPECPMLGVTWYEATRYCNWLSKQEGLPEDQWCYVEPIEPGMIMPEDYLRRRGYRLPTEAEWEYACRSRTASSRFFGNQASRLREYCWYAENSGDQSHPVGTLKPNDLGLFDMHGNVWEWGQDPFEMIDPAQPDLRRFDREHTNAVTSASIRVLRGGSFNYQAVYLRSADRDWNLPASRIEAYGFRVARTWR